jgi:hypothetical protein
MIRTLVDRFHGQVLSRFWEQAQPQLQRIVRDLERILGVLHPRIEYPAPLLEDWVGATGNTTIDAVTNIDITGATITVTPEVDTRYLVNGCFDVTCTALAAFGDLISCRLSAGGVVQSHRSGWSPHVANERDTLCHSWTVLVSAGVATTIKLVATCTNAATTFTVTGSNTGFTIASFPLAYRLP